MSATYTMPDDSKQWWDLVWFLPATTSQPLASGWLELDAHPCGGFGCYSLDGWVMPAAGALLQELQRDIVDESWCSNRLGLDYEVTEASRIEFAAFLIERGLAPGDLSMLRQAVYPLARTAQVCERFGIVPADDKNAALLVLGPNCD